MKVILAKSSGFCFGVKRATDIALEASRTAGGDSVFTDGPLIHNPQALAMLRQRGVFPLQEGKGTIEGTVIIRSHGVSPERLNRLNKTGATIVDATCPKVKKVQSIIGRCATRGSYVVIVGDEDHAEVKGLRGFAGKDSAVVQSEDEVAKLPLKNKVCVVAQTTQSKELFFHLAEKIKERFPEAQIFDTICEANRNRQEELKTLCHSVEAIIVVGGKGSANTKRLAEIAESKGVPTFFVENEEELNLDELKPYNEVGVIGGASTPDWVLQRVVDTLESAGVNKN